jgi:hypothetical protein
MTENTTTKNEATTKATNTATTATAKKPVRKEKPIEENGNGKIKAAQFNENKNVIEAIIKGKKLDEKETAAVKYFVNYVINEYNRGVVISTI